MNLMLFQTIPITRNTRPYSIRNKKYPKPSGNLLSSHNKRRIFQYALAFTYFYEYNKL